MNTATNELGETDGGGGGGGGGEGRVRRVRRRWPVLVGAIVGAVAFSGALLAQQRDGDEPPPATRWEHTWPPEVSGQVWITVDAEDAATRNVTIRWGPFERPILHTSADPMTYVFTKEPTPEGESSVPITIDVEPGAVVEFGDGPPPSPSEDVNSDWVEVPR